ncbi:MAG TPA: diguanylate cyclase, partial [Chloroflexota bacterium]
LGQTEFPPHPERGYLTGTCMAVPVAWGDTLHGVLCAADPEDGECFTSHDLMILQLLGEQLAAGINALGRARTLADLDDLTGVQNRRAFEARLAAEVERSRRYGRPLSLAMVDVDGLKRLNERGGRRLGDEVLQRVAEVLLRTVRRVDTVGRYGGDEFAVLLPETGATEALIAAQRLADAVRALAIPGADGALAVRVSIGASSWPPASNVEDLVDQAYRALYAAKRSREGVRHWQLGSGLPQPHGYPCTCRTCGRVFMVAGLAQQRVRRYCSLECAASARRQPKRDRNETIRALRASGLTLREIAERYGISEERVRQICRDGGV